MYEYVQYSYEAHVGSSGQIEDAYVLAANDHRMSSKQIADDRTDGSIAGGSLT